MGRKILIIIGIFILSLIVFYIAIFITLPTSALEHFAEKSIEKALGQKQSIEIEHLSISPLLNLTATDVRITPRVTDNSNSLSLEGGTYNGYYCAPSVEDQPFIINHLYINPSIFSSLKGNYSGKFELDQEDNGAITGEFNSKKGKIIEVKAKADEISLNDFSLLSNYTKMQIYGSMNFDLRTVIENKTPSALNAKISAQNTALCPKRIKLNMPNNPFPHVDVPFTYFGNIDGDIEIKDGKLIINHLTSDGPDIVLNIKGDVTLKKPKDPLMRFNIEAIITPSEDWLKEGEMNIYSMCEKHEDGSIHLKVTGTSKKPNIDCGKPTPGAVPPKPPKAEPEKKAVDPPKDPAPKKEEKTTTAQEEAPTPPPEEPPSTVPNEPVQAPSMLKPPRADRPQRDPADRNRIVRPSSRAISDIERASTRMNRPLNENPRINSGNRERFNRAIEEDDQAATENRRRRHQLPPGE